MGNPEKLVSMMRSPKCESLGSPPALHTPPHGTDHSYTAAYTWRQTLTPSRSPRQYIFPGDTYKSCFQATSRSPLQSSVSWH